VRIADIRNGCLQRRAYFGLRQDGAAPIGIDREEE
jgi:hypothetical protein